MRRLLPAALAAVMAAAPMGGCSHLSTPSARTVTLRETQALYLAEAAFRGSSLALEAAIDAGVLKGAAAAKARAAYDKAHAALAAARAAKAAGDHALADAQAGAALDAAAQVQQLAETGGGFGQGGF